MKGTVQPRVTSFPYSSVRAVAVTAGLLMVALASVTARAQTFQILHNFTGGSDGDYPIAGLAIDSAGNLYGTTEKSSGTVYKLAHKNSGWVLSELFNFNVSDGNEPFGRPIIGPDGTFYSTTGFGGSRGNGVVFRLRPSASPPVSAYAPWVQTELYSFTGGSDGGVPGFGSLTFDAAGSIYGTTASGGLQDCNGFCGVVYKLTPSNGSWTESVLYAFTGLPDGNGPQSGVVLDQNGNIYGTTFSGGSLFNDGAVYELSPSGSGWTETILYAFQGGTDGRDPNGGLVRDSAGNLYGATRDGGAAHGGTVFELSPSDGSWTYKLLYSIPGSYGGGPYDSLLLDAAGNLYGVAAGGGVNGVGVVFKLTPNSDGTWTYSSLHDFDGSDGELPYGGLAVDRAGNFYGTASEGGTYGNGVVYEITP